MGLLNNFPLVQYIFESQNYISNYSDKTSLAVIDFNPKAMLLNRANEGNTHSPTNPPATWHVWKDW